RARQRALRGRRRRDRAAQAPARVRRAHPPAPAHRHLLRAGRQGQRALLRPQAGQRDPWTRDLWIYDLRTNKNFTLKETPIVRADLDEFVTCYKPENRHERVATWSEHAPNGRWRAYPYGEIMARDKASLDIFWL